MAMTEAMKRFIMGRGITALTLAERCGMCVPRDIYMILWGYKAPTPELHDVLCGIYGMTEEEFTAAMPERRKHNASSGTNRKHHQTAAHSGGTRGADAGA